MHRTALLISTAWLEAGIGILLLAFPAIVIWLLLGIDRAAVEATFIARIAGAALLALGMASWSGRIGVADSAQRGLIAAVLIYHAAATALLAYCGLVLRLTG